jgi:hypothetical protein
MSKSDLHGLHGLAGGCQLAAGDIRDRVAIESAVVQSVFPPLYRNHAEEGKFGLLAAIFPSFLAKYTQTASRGFASIGHDSSLRTPQSNHAAIVGT